MMNDPMIRYHIATGQQRERWQEAELARQARAATPDQASLMKQREATPDLTGQVERVIQHVWNRLGLPAREPDSRLASGPGARPSGPLGPTHPANVSL